MVVIQPNKMKHFSILILIILNLVACGQLNSNQKQEQMDLSKIINEKVKKAIEALQSGNESWYSYFTGNPEMTDDGNPKDFHKFFKGALEKEHFLTIDKVENNGMDVYGNFKAGIWGSFKVYFKFHENSEGKFDRLDIGRAKYQ